MNIEGKIFEILVNRGCEGIKVLASFFEKEEALLIEGFSILERSKQRIIKFQRQLERYLPPEPITNQIMRNDILKRILFVDDDDMWCSFYEKTGHLLGYSVKLAKDAETALNIVKDEKPDLIITDIKMPKISGLTLLKELRRRKYNIPAIIVTGYPSHTISKSAEEMNVKKILIKPVKIKELKDAIDLSLSN